MPAHFLSDLVARPEAAWSIQDLSTGTLLATHVMAAFDRHSRNRGLLDRAGLERGDALVLAPCFSVHTWFMRFPIDLLFVSRDGVVLKARPAVAPWRMAARLGAFAVIELCAGAGAGVNAGDQLGLTALDDSADRADRARLPAAAFGSDAGQKFVPRLSGG